MEDKFGDNGLIAAVIMKPLDEETLFVDTWLMSCRVLKRGMENFTLNTMVESARAKGYERIVGEYLPTPKNGMVKEHYPNLGFDSMDNGRFVLEIENYKERKCFINKE